jgi:hypothetical protein
MTMTTRKPTAAKRAAEIAKLDLLPGAEARRRSDALLRAMLSRPPDPFTPKPKKANKPKPAK